MDRSIIITGASSGIGRVTALEFLAAGWRVGLVARRAEPLQALVQAHDRALALHCDVTQEAEVDAAFDTAMQAWGRIDVLFNNAGVGLKSVLPDEMEVAQWHRVMNTNVTGMFLSARAAFSRMRHQDPQGGRIINNGSVSAHVPRPGSIAYTASKHAVTGMTRSLSLDGRPFNITCGQIDIGNAMTDMAAGQRKGVPQADGSIRPEPMIDAAEVAASVRHMADLPAGTNIQFMTVMAAAMPYIGRG
ncbi:3-oxoacyl-ACP reductase [Thioclava sp. SK-1]|uniref:SDR family oxidoreductase n=1 Tax=Thioclava sp. SK-1 TaxID=1889770 RepID=UPI0008256CF1|nr:SDR family oxidoreductase [Thioclava sp. SK-1]OCX62254.1 3-oxoacyl-ACP reductase [Thioclava sp. SK-1]